MVKTKQEQRQESVEKRFGGNGTIHITQIIEKTELLANCRLFARMTINPGCSLGYHQHENEEEIYYILSGQGVVNDNGTMRTVNPGDAVLTGNGASHSIENQGTEPLELVATVLTYQPPER